MAEQNATESNESEVSPDSWLLQLKNATKTPLGLFGVCLTTVFFVLTCIGMLLHMTGDMDNPYTPIITVFLFPSFMLLGLIFIPLAAFLQKRKSFNQTLVKDDFKIDFGNPLHRKNIILIAVLTSVNIAVFSVAAYEGYHYMDSPEFCGLVCHEIMLPEYTLAQTSPHSNVACVGCHIGPGVSGLVKAKVSGLRQLKGVIVGDYQKPVPVPVHNLPPAEATCEKCHSPKAYTGTKTKKFVSYSNDDQSEPEEETDLLLYVGGFNPATEMQEGIHWHNMEGLKIEYIPLNDKRTQIGQVKATRPDGTVVVYEYESDEESAATHGWRTMDCTDCHNRAAHIYEELDEVVDFGLMSAKLDPEIEGLREDSITVLEKKYPTKAAADKAIETDLLALQQERHGAEFVTENRDELLRASNFLKATYARNIWPEIGTTWGQYKSHLGHKYEDEGFGCFRCHDDVHESANGDIIAQDCDICHEEPE